METNKNIHPSELSKIDTNKLIQVTEFEKNLRKLVKENEFIEVVDAETYKIAKLRKSNLRKARLELRTTGKTESQESILLNKINVLRDFVKEKITFLVEIPSTVEDKFTQTIENWEAKIKEEQAEQDRKETERVKAIKDEIENVKNTLQGAIDNSKFNTLVDDKLAFNLLKTSTFDFEEYKFLFDEMIDEMTTNFENKVSEIESVEQTRLENLKKDRESAINKMIIEGQKIVDDLENLMDDQVLKKQILKTFDHKEMEIYFDFASVDLIRTEQQKCLDKVFNKLTSIKDKMIMDQKTQLIERKGELMEIIFDMTIDKIDEVKEYVKTSFEKSEGIFPELHPDFEKAQKQIEQTLQSQLDRLKPEIEKAEKEIQEKIQLRKQKLIELGMIEKETENGFMFENYGISIDGFTISSLDDSDWMSAVEYVEKEKKSNQDEIDRQERLNPDKFSIQAFLLEIENDFIQFDLEVLKNQESKDFYNEIKESFIEWAKNKLESIEKF